MKVSAASIKQTAAITSRRRGLFTLCCSDLVDFAPTVLDFADLFEDFVDFLLFVFAIPPPEAGCVAAHWLGVERLYM